MVIEIARQTGIRTVDPVTDAAWAELVTSRPSTIFHSPDWMRAIQKTYGFNPEAAVIEQDGTPLAGLPWLQFSDFVGDRRISLAFSDFCDPLFTTPDQARTLAEAAFGNGDQPWNLRARVSNLPDVAFPVIGIGEYKWHGVDLTPDEDALWKRMASMTQRGVKKAKREGVEIRIAQDKSELREWFLLHMRLRREKHELLAQPYSFFENIWDAFVEKGQGFLMNAIFDGKIIGGTLYLNWQDTCYYKFNASDPDYLQVRPNNLLMWQGMLTAKERGFRMLDFGRSSADQDGLVTYKRSFGSNEDDMHSVTYGYADRQKDTTKQAKQLLGNLTRLFIDQGVSDDVMEEAGNLLYPYFS